MITINGTREQTEDLIKEMESFIADRKNMLNNCEQRKKQVLEGLFKHFGKEHNEKLVAEEGDLINRISNQIKVNSEILVELKEAFNKQFS